MLVHTSTELVESFLRSEKLFNEQNQILPSENLIIENLLKYSESMHRVYAEITEQLPNPNQWQLVIKNLVMVAAFWNPAKTQGMRKETERLRQINAEIARRADELAALLAERAEISNQSSICSNSDSHPMDWIERAARDFSDPELSFRFENYLAPMLDEIRYQYDLKYWPSTASVLMAVSAYGAEAQINTVDLITTAAIASRKQSVWDFYRAISEALDLLRTATPNRIPKRFRLSDHAIAEIINCMLALTPDALVEAHQVKYHRHNPPSLKQV